jgi:flagellar motor switch protein FliM
MSDSKILSSEEMDELSKVPDEGKIDLTQIIGSNVAASSEKKSQGFSSKKLSNITDVTWTECQQQFGHFTRKKMLFSLKQAEILSQENALKDKLEKRIYLVAKILPQNVFSLVIFDLSFLHQVINILFGGEVNENDVVIDKPGKISMTIAEKIGRLVLDSFVVACKEHGEISYEIIKTVTSPNLITKIQDNDKFYCMDMDVKMGTFESAINLMIDEQFILKFIPTTEEASVPNTKNSWKTAIQSQVVDSLVTLSVTLPDIKVNLKDFLEMKQDALISIPDPTAVYIGLNNIKIYRANAGQRNDKRVVEVEREI